MNLAKQKEAATAFLRALDKLDPATLANLVSDNFEFEMMGRLPGVKPILGKHKFLSNMPKTLIAMFPNGLNMKLLTVVAEGPHVAIQAVGIPDIPCSTLKPFFSSRVVRYFEVSNSWKPSSP